MTGWWSAALIGAPSVRLRGAPRHGSRGHDHLDRIFRMENGKAAEGWLESDFAALRDQLVAEPG